ncbi:hypothetical protein [Streptomyces filamentosus]
MFGFQVICVTAGVVLFFCGFPAIGIALVTSSAIQITVNKR